MRTMLVMTLLAALLGCASRNAAAPAPVTIQSDADYDRLWDSAVAVVGARFPISAAEKGKGTIETTALIGAASMTGLKYNAGADALPEENLRTVRRKATVIVDRSAAEPLVVRIEKQRLLRERPNVLPTGTYALSTRRPYEYVDVEGNRWMDAGRDEELEATLAREIADRFRK